MALKRGNGQGCIIKDKIGKRRKIFRMTIGWEINETEDKGKQILKDIGIQATCGEAEREILDYLDKPS